MAFVSIFPVGNRISRWEHYLMATHLMEVEDIDGKSISLLEISRHVADNGGISLKLGQWSSVFSTSDYEKRLSPSWISIHSDFTAFELGLVPDYVEEKASVRESSRVNLELREESADSLKSNSKPTTESIFSELKEGEPGVPNPNVLLGPTSIEIYGESDHGNPNTFTTRQLFWLQHMICTASRKKANENTIDLIFQGILYQASIDPVVLFFGREATMKLWSVVSAHFTVLPKVSPEFSEDVSPGFAQRLARSVPSDIKNYVSTTVQLKLTSPQLLTKLAEYSLQDYQSPLSRGWPLAQGEENKVLPIQAVHFPGSWDVIVQKLRDAKPAYTIWL